MCSVKLGWEFDCSCLSWLVPSPTLSLLSCPCPLSSSEDVLCVMLTLVLGGRVSVVQCYLFAEGTIALLGLHRARDDSRLTPINQLLMLSVLHLR